MKRFGVIGALLLFLFPLSAAADKKIRVVTTTPDLADIALRVGGDSVVVESLSKGYQNPHFVDAKPSLIVKMMKADVYIKVGMEIEIGWAPLLERGSRNKRVLPGGSGYINASKAVEAKEIPKEVSRAHGDVHPEGNPHYLLDPENAKKVATLIGDRLASLYPNKKSKFSSNVSQFHAELDEKIAEWKKMLDPYKGAKFVGYHKDSIYFAEFFHFESVGEIEPKPGIPPTASHTSSLIDRMKKEQIKVIVTQPWYEKRTTEFISRETGAKVLIMSIMPFGVPEATTYIEAMDYNVHLFRDALK